MRAGGRDLKLDAYQPRGVTTPTPTLVYFHGGGWTNGTTSTEELKVAAIINWYGITDVVDLIDRTPGPSGAPTVAWLGSSRDRVEIAERVSPPTYVRHGLPPIPTIHGDADPIVPYSHGLRLHQALDEAGVPNELVTVAGGGHGGFTDEESVRIYTAIRDFLRKHDVWQAGGAWGTASRASSKRREFRWAL